MAAFPVDDVLGKALDSKIADMRNSSGRAAGTICGGMFIQKFAEGLPWLHLDIAGTSYTDGNTTCSFGATGVGVRLLYHTAKNCEKIAAFSGSLTGSLKKIAYGKFKLT